MSYIEQSLAPGEIVIERFQIHWFAYLWPTILCLTVVLSIFGLPRILTLRFTEYGLTNRRVIKKTGVLSRNTAEMPLRSLETATLHQSLFDRIMGSGTVRMTGRGISDVILYGIDAPLEAKKRIETARHEAEARTGA